MRQQQGSVRVFRVLALAVIVGVPTAAWTADFSSSLTLPATAHLKVVANGCSNSPGPTITLSGTVALGDISGDLILKNNTRGTHKAVVTDVISGVVLDFGDGVSVPKQPSRSADTPCAGTGVGGNPFIWLQLLDDRGYALTTPAFLGRCVQGLTADLNAEFLEAALATGHIGGEMCFNNPGPYLSFTGDIILRGVKGRVIFKNNPNPPAPHEAQCATTFDVIASTNDFKICKSPSSSQNGCEYEPGAGGNPIVCIRLDTETSTSGELCFGRCNKL